MNVVIGLWIIALAMTLMFVSLDPNMDFKQGVKTVVGIMIFVTMIFVGAYFLSGGVE